METVSYWEVAGKGFRGDRPRSCTCRVLRYRWTETGALDHYRYAHAFDHLYGAFRRSLGVVEYIG